MSTGEASTAASLSREFWWIIVEQHFKPPVTPPSLYLRVDNIKTCSKSVAPFCIRDILAPTKTILPTCYQTYRGLPAMDTSYLTTQVSSIIGQLHGLFEEIGVSSHERESRESEVSTAIQNDAEAETNNRDSFLLLCQKRCITNSAWSLCELPLIQLRLTRC